MQREKWHMRPGVQESLELEATLDPVTTVRIIVITEVSAAPIMPDGPTSWLVEEKRLGQLVTPSVINC